MATRPGKPNAGRLRMNNYLRLAGAVTAAVVVTFPHWGRRILTHIETRLFEE